MVSLTHRPFQLVDVFTDTAGLGNPLAVVLDGSGLSDETMQRFARWIGGVGQATPRVENIQPAAAQVPQR